MNKITTSIMEGILVLQLLVLCTIANVEGNRPSSDLSLGTGISCTDPNGVPGSCLIIRNCPSVMNTLLDRLTDQTYIKYVRESSRACAYNGQEVCCPLTTPSSTEAPPVTTPVSVEKQTEPAKVYTLLKPNECGYTNATFPRIVSNVAQKGVWQWLALLSYTDKLGKTSYKCGGSLITGRHVLTEANCLTSELTSVRMGKYDLTNVEEVATLDVPVQKTFQHPKFNKRNGHSNLAILYLDRDVSESFKPICLPVEDPVKSRNFIGYLPFVAGWGVNQQECSTSDVVLQNRQIPILNNEVCASAYRDANRLISANQFDETVLCAGYLKLQTTSVCLGDSGGPLMIPILAGGGSLNFYQIGVMSHSGRCDLGELPGIYTQVTTYIDWIEKTVAEPIL